MKIVSGGQTGVDRAALDAAMSQKLSIGGWCPKKRKAEDGMISEKYPLKETPTDEYSQRTEWNVRDSEATLIIVKQLPLKGGTAFTKTQIEKYNKPHLILSLADSNAFDHCLEWILKKKPKTLNIAGPRESGESGIYKEAFQFLSQIFERLTREH